MKKPPKGKDQFTAQQFIDAIPGTGGIVSAIARRVGCTWNTAQKYIATYPTVKAAYDAEVESTLDVAESVLLDNIRMARKMQTEDKTLVDTSDVRWYLAKKGKARGYVERQEVQAEISSKDSDAIPIRLVDYRAGITEAS